MDYTRTRPVAYQDLMKPGEDWRKLQNHSERRRIQNRIAQRAYRRNMRERTNEVEALRQKILELQENTWSDKGGNPHADLDQNGAENVRRSSIPGSMSKTKPADKQCRTVVTRHDAPGNSCGNSDEFVFPRDLSTECSVQQPPPPKPQPTLSAPASSDTQVQSLSKPARPHSTTAPLLMEHLEGEPDLQPFGQPEISTTYRMATRGPPTPRTPGDISLDGLHQCPPCVPYESNTLTSALNHSDFPAISTRNSPFSGTSTPPLMGSNALIHLAIAAGNADTLQLLLETLDLPTNTRDHAGYTPLQRAILSGRPDLVAILLACENEVASEDELSSDLQDGDGFVL